MKPTINKKHKTASPIYTIVTSLWHLLVSEHLSEEQQAELHSKLLEHFAPIVLLYVSSSSPSHFITFIKKNTIELNKFIFGGNGSDTMNPNMPDNGHMAYEAGSPNIVAISGLNASIDWLQKTKVYEKELDATHYLINSLKKLNNVKLFLPEDYESKIFGVVSIGIDKYSADAYRFYLLGDSLNSELSLTLANVEKYEKLVRRIGEAYNAPFEQSNYENSYANSFFREINRLLDSHEISKFTNSLISFFEAYVETHKITKNESIKFLIILSLVAPQVAEDINKNILKNRYSIFYSEFPR